MNRTDRYSAVAFAAAVFSMLCLSVLAGDSGFVLSVDNAVTSVVSNVQTSRGWKRTFVIGEKGGTLLDASGRIADYQSGAAVEAAAAHLPEIMDAAHTGLTNSLAKLYAATNHIGEFTDRVFIAGDLQADSERANWWCYIANEARVGPDDVFYVWFSQDMPNPPRMVFRYRLDVGVAEVEANWELPWSGNSYDCGDFRGCRKCSVPRPASVGNVTMRVNAYPRIGTDEGGVDFARKVFAFVDGTVTNFPWTGLWTNSAGRVWQFNNGVYTGEVEQ